MSSSRTSSLTSLHVGAAGRLSSFSNSNLFLLLEPLLIQQLPISQSSFEAG
eukprot:m.89194 g.89194  ORF g.89194 m.89194 type:complete len:51 (+) comp11711_c0_seq2:1516-1668(+)